MMEPVSKEIKIDRSASGRHPFIEWFESLRDERTRQKIQARIDRLSLGNSGYSRGVGGGVRELKIDYGPGFRVYYGIDGDVLIILLIGGDKSSQDGDIKKAKDFWKAYKGEKKNAP